MTAVDGPEAFDWAAFGDWLRRRRFAVGFDNAARAAAAARLSADTWAALEGGGRTVKGEWVRPSPSDSTLLRIADALFLHPGELFHRLRRPVPPGVEDRASALSEADVDRLLSLPGVRDMVIRRLLGG